MDVGGDDNVGGDNNKLFISWDGANIQNSADGLRFWRCPYPSLHLDLMPHHPQAQSRYHLSLHPLAMYHHHLEGLSPQ